MNRSDPFGQLFSVVFLFYFFVFCVPNLHLLNLLNDL